MRKTLFVATLLALAAGCGEPEDKPSRVTDLRVLAVAAHPPEVLFDRATGRFDQPDVTFEALVADPRGGVVKATWSFCPIESADGCRDYDPARAPAEARALLERMRRREEGEGRPSLEPARGIGVFDLPSFSVTMDPGLVDYHLGSSALGMGNGAWLSAVLTADGAETVTAQKRLLLGVRDLSAYDAELQARFGFQVCPPGEPAPPGCLPLAPRVPNRNPAVDEIRVARGATAGLPFAPLPPDGVLHVRAGEKVRLLPVLAADAEEAYQEIVAAFEGHRLEVVERREQVVASWFATAGKMGNDVTAAPLTKTLDDVFTAPEVPPPGGALSLWVVVRDQRGGTGWRHLQAVVDR